MGVSKIALDAPVDIIVETERHIVAGSYRYDGARSGKIQYLDKRTKEIVHEHATTGTLCACVHNGLVYCANAHSISILREDGIAKEIRTEAINTYIDCGTHVAVADTGGRVSLFSHDLELVRSLGISGDTVWVAKEIRDRLYIGTEEGLAYEYSFGTDQLVQIGARRTGILDFIEIGGRLCVSSYDGNVELYEFGTLRRCGVFQNVGSLWKMVCHGTKIHCSCVYDGYRVFDTDFNLLATVPTDSICYALCIAGGEVLWSSFYDNCIFYRGLDDTN